MRPRVRRIRRWSFVATLPGALLVAHLYGAHHGVAVVAGRMAWVVTALHAYTLVWLWGFALGLRAYPHRVGARTAVLRAGPMYRVLVPRSTIAATADRERVPGERGLVERDGAVLLARAAASTRPPPTKASRRTLSAAAE